MSDHEITEHEIQLTEHDMDHLNDGQPVFRGIGKDTRVVIKPDVIDDE